MSLFRKKQPSRSRAYDDAKDVDQATSFRRNRTINAVRQQPISETEPSPREKAHSLARRRRKIGIILLTIIVIGSVLSWLLSQFTATVAINVSDKTSMIHPVKTETYASAIQDYLDMHPFERLRFVLNQNELSQYVSGKLPEVATIEQIGRSNIGETNFQISMRVPVAGWLINSQQYYVDGAGEAFALNYFNEPTVTITDNSGVSLESGQAVASSRFLGFVGRVVALAEERGYTVTEAIIPYNTTRQLDIKLEGQAPLVRLSIDRGAGEQMEDMARSLNYLSASGQAPEYIDVRVKNKTFYK